MKGINIAAFRRREDRKGHHHPPPPRRVVYTQASCRVLSTEASIITSHLRSANI